MNVKIGTKRWKLPDVLNFEGEFATPRLYSISEYRPPRAGEWYVSGAIPQAHLAQEDYTADTSFLIAVPGPKAMKITKIVWIAINKNDQSKPA